MSIICNVLSLLIYILTIKLFPMQLMLADMHWSFLGWIFIILFISWGPLYVMKLLLRAIDPSDFEKLMKTTQNIRNSQV